MQASATFTARTSDRLRRIGRALVDGVLPPRCLSCGEIVDQPDALCSRCWGGITFFAPPWCVLCGLPFPHPMGEDAVCGDCAREPPTWHQARAVLRYDKNSRRLLLGFKHGDHTHSAAAFGRWMRRAGSEVLAGADLLVPVPLHWTRLFQRRYNQAALLAQAVHGAGGPRPRSLCDACPPQCRRQARGDHRRCNDDGGYGRGMRPRAEACGRRVHRRADPGTGAADRGMNQTARAVVRVGVELKTTPFCPYCVRARALLERKGVAFREIDIIEEPARRIEMVRRAGGRTSVPQIFIGGEHIGGSDELLALDRNGELDAKLGTSK